MIKRAPNFKDLTGNTYNSLKAIRLLSERGKNYEIFYECECLICGKLTKVNGNNLTRGQVKTYGDHRVSPAKTHGLRKHPLYNRWTKMRDRCHNPKSKSYEDYGGRGITVQESWRKSFKEFYDYCYAIHPDLDELLKLPDTEIDRIDNSGDYEEGNIRFTTKKENTNNRRSCIYIELNNEILSLTEAVNKYPVEGLSYDTINARTLNGWNILEALFTPLYCSIRTSYDHRIYQSSPAKAKNIRKVKNES